MEEEDPNDFFPDFDTDLTPSCTEEQNGGNDIYGTGQSSCFTFDLDGKSDYSSNFISDSNSITPKQMARSDGVHQRTTFMSAAPSPIDANTANPIRRYGSSQRFHSFSCATSQQPQIARRPISKLPSKLCTSAMEQFKPRKQKKPIEKWESANEYGARTDELFFNLLTTNFVVNPARMGFIPSLFWSDKEFPFSVIVLDGFQRKNNLSCRFIHKLYNAIRFTIFFPDYEDVAGVKFINTYVLKVNKHCFARLLGIKSIDGGLFHGQGNFPSIGFKELNKKEAEEVYCKDCDISDVDYDNIRLLIDTKNMFTANWNEETVFRYTNTTSK